MVTNLVSQVRPMACQRHPLIMVATMALPTASVPIGLIIVIINGRVCGCRGVVMPGSGPMVLAHPAGLFRVAHMCHPLLCCKRVYRELVAMGMLPLWRASTLMAVCIPAIGTGMPTVVAGQL